MPHVNFSLPVGLLAPLRAFLEHPGGPGALEALAGSWEACAADEQEGGLWRLEAEDLGLPSRAEARLSLALRRMDELQRDAEGAEEARGASSAGQGAAPREGAA
ncbi:unnamed protein product, partial [Prorocentrum cordatum]